MRTIKPTTCLLLAFTLLSLSSAAALGHDHKDVPSFVIDLDLPPKERYLELLPHYNDTVWGFYNDYFAKDFVLREALYGISAKRGPEPEEMMEEIQGLADASRLPVKFVKAIQMLYELQTLMVPVTNVSFPHLGDMIKGENARWFDDIPAEFEPLATRLPWRGPGCTGIIATNKEDGVVYHARNLDFSPLKVMTNLVYNGVFKKNGTELFQSQMIAGYTMVITGIKLGPNGYAIERNTRYTDHKGGNKEMLSHLFSGRPLNGWSLRKIMETETEYYKPQNEDEEKQKKGLLCGIYLILQQSSTNH